MKTLTDKQAIFIKHYLVDHNGTQAAIKAGYSKKAAAEISYELLRRPHIALAIAKDITRRMHRLDIEADDIVQEIAKMGFACITDYYRSDGSMIPPQDLPRHLRAAVQEVVQTILPNGTVVFKYKLADKTKNLELLGKHLKLFTDKVEVDVLSDVYESIANNANSSIKNAVKH